MSDEATARPWKIETVKTSCGHVHKIGPFPWNERENWACIYVDDYYSWKYGPELKANAELIVRAVNTYDEREAMLRDLRGFLKNWAIDLETGKTKAAVAHGLREMAARIDAILPAPDGREKP